MVMYGVVLKSNETWLRNRPGLCMVPIDEVAAAIEQVTSVRPASDYVVMGTRPGDELAFRICQADLWVGPSRTGAFAVSWSEPAVKLPDVDGELADQAAHREASDFLNRDRWL